MPLKKLFALRCNRKNLFRKNKTNVEEKKNDVSYNIVYIKLD